MKEIDTKNYSFYNSLRNIEIAREFDQIFAHIM